MAKEIDEIKKAAGDYQRWALEARKQYINLRLRQDKEIANLYIRSADRIAKELQQIGTTTISGQIRKKHFEELEKSLRAEAELIQKGLTEAFVDYIDSAVKAGVGYTQGVVLNLFDQAGLKTSGIRKLFSRVNKQAVEAIWARTRNGLYLSDRIWEQGEKYRNTMRDIIQEAVAIGQDAVTTARMLQQYVRQGKSTLAANYPNMMKRMTALRIPGDISYEALRLARTEMTAAFGEGTIAAARVSPSYIGMKWVLSHSHPVVDICDTLAEHDEGLGRGVYSPGNEPPLPAHPNCICTLVPVHEEPEKFVERLKKWRDDPSSDQELEKWYNNIYQEKAAEKQNRLTQSIKELEAEERGIDRETPIITTKDFDEEITDRIKASNDPSNLMLQPEYEEIFLKKGFSREEIETVKKILSDYGGVAEQQKKAMETIAAEIKNDSRIGKLLRATSDLEEAAVEVWQSGLEDRIKKALKAAKENWDLFGEAEGFSQDYSDFSEVETAIRMRLEKEASLVVYRKGDLGRPIESWTADPLGADIGAGRRLTPDHAMTLREMHERGYKILGGTCRMMGAPGEMEITFINFDKCIAGKTTPSKSKP